MMIAHKPPFVLSLSKPVLSACLALRAAEGGCTSLQEGLGFDKLSPNGSGVGEA